MDDRRAALLLALLALAGAGVRLALAPAKAAAPGDVRLVSVDTPPPGGLSATARKAARLARPLLPGERVDLDRADVTEITRLPRIGPAFAQRIVAWRERHGPRSEEHTSELQSPCNLVCRLLLEKKKKKKIYNYRPMFL